MYAAGCSLFVRERWEKMFRSKKFSCSLGESCLSSPFWQPEFVGRGRGAITSWGRRSRRRRRRRRRPSFKIEKRSRWRLEIFPFLSLRVGAERPEGERRRGLAHVGEISRTNSVQALQHWRFLRITAQHELRLLPPPPTADAFPSPSHFGSCVLCHRG